MSRERKRTGDRPRLDRRRVAGGLAAGAATLAAGGLAAPALAQARGRVVVVGGGAAGATVARYLTKDGPEIDVTLVSDRPVYTTCFFSNLYLAGFRSLQSLSFRYDQLASRYGVRVVIERAVDVDRNGRRVRLASGATLPYDRLVLAPGVSFQRGAVEGYDAAASQVMPHAYEGGYQTFLLRERLREMRPGGVFVIAPPVSPYRCPPAPYERASMAALLFSRINPRAKILIVDAKDSFSKQALFEDGWAKRYPGMIEWVPASFNGGGIARVDPNAMTLTTVGGETIQADAACVIPAQQAAALAFQAGLVDSGGWAPVDGSTLRSTIDPSVYVIGDAARVGAMPKSGFAANSQAHQAAGSVKADLLGERLFPARYRNTCWSYIAAHDVVRIGASYRVVEGDVRAVSTLSSAVEDSVRDRLDNALQANAWYASVTSDMFA